MKEFKYVISHNKKDITYSDTSQVISIQAYDSRWKDTDPNDEKDLHNIKTSENISKIELSGMKQNEFENVLNYLPKQLPALILFKCPDIVDFSPLEQLKNLKELFIYWNRKATKIWKLKENINLSKLTIIDCNKLTDFKNFRDSHIEELSLQGCNGLSSFTPKLVVDDMNDILDIPNLKILSFSVVKNYADDELLLKLSRLPKIEEFRFIGNEFSFEQFSWLKSKLPHVRGLEATDGIGVVIGRGNANINESKLNAYRRKYDNLVAFYLNVSNPPM